MKNVTLMYQVGVTAYTARGEFFGVINAAAAVQKDAEELRDTIQKNINDMTYLVLFDPKKGQEILLNKTVLAQSVLVFKMVTTLQKSIEVNNPET